MVVIRFHPGIDGGGDFAIGVVERGGDPVHRVNDFGNLAVGIVELHRRVTERVDGFGNLAIGVVKRGRGVAHGASVELR